MLVEISGRKLRYDLLGKKCAPVVFLAHSLSADSGIWAEQVPPLLAAGWQVLRLDMRGHGGSDAGGEDYTMAALAQDVAKLLDFLEIKRVHFVGLSIGGMIGQTFALDFPERILSLMLCGTSPSALDGGMDLWKPRFDAIERKGSVEPLADATMVRWFTDEFATYNPCRLRQIHHTVSLTSPEGYRGGANAINSFDVRDRLPRLEVPTLVLCGDEDIGTPPKGNRLIAELVPGAQYVELVRARHIPMVQYPEMFSKILLDWLAAQGNPHLS